MINAKFKSIVVLSVILPLLLVGCWDRTEVDNLAIVTGIGLDQIPGQDSILLTIQIVNPSAMQQGNQGGAQQNPFIVRTIEGKSFFEAIGNFTKELPRRVYFDHNEIVVLGQDFAKTGIADVFDYMERNKEFRATNLILVTDKTAKEVIEAKFGLEKLSSIGIGQLLDKNLITYPINRYEFLLGLNHIGVSFAPLVELVDRGNEMNLINIAKTAIFKDYRLIGFLTEEESQGLLWLTTKIKEDSVVIPPKENDRAGEITIDIFAGNTKITPHISEQGIKIEISCSGQARVREAGNTGIAVDKREEFAQLERITERILQERIEKTINSAQNRFKADFIGFANPIQNIDPVLWKSLEKDWDQYFPNIDYQVSTKIEITNMGIYRGSINDLKRKE